MLGKKGHRNDVSRRFQRRKGRCGVMQDALGDSDSSIIFATRWGSRWAHASRWGIAVGVTRAVGNLAGLI